MDDHTIEDIKTAKLWLEIQCLDCERISQTPHRMLPDFLKPDLPARLAAAYYRCPKCQSKNLVSRMVDALAEQPKLKG